MAEENGFVDISLSQLRKKRIRLDGDDNRVIELNVTDISILTRLSEADKMIAEARSTLEEVNEDTAPEIVVQRFAEADDKIKETINYIFNADVADKCANGNSMLAPIDGQYCYEYIIDTLFALYENGLQEEAKKIQKRIKSHTDKYTKKK